jgi:hypothetical protein
MLKFHGSKAQKPLFEKMSHGLRPATTKLHTVHVLVDEI